MRFRDGASCRFLLLSDYSREFHRRSTASLAAAEGRWEAYCALGEVVDYGPDSETQVTERVKAARSLHHPEGNTNKVVTGTRRH